MLPGNPYPVIFRNFPAPPCLGEALRRGTLSQKIDIVIRGVIFLITGFQEPDEAGYLPGRLPKHSVQLIQAFFEKIVPITHSVSCPNPIPFNRGIRNPMHL